MKPLATGTNLRQKYHKWYCAPENRSPFPQHLESHRPSCKECTPLSLDEVKADLRAAFSPFQESERAVHCLILQRIKPMSDEAKRKRIIRLPTPRHDQPCQRIPYPSTKELFQSMLVDSQDG